MRRIGSLLLALCLLLSACAFRNTPPKVEAEQPPQEPARQEAPLKPANDEQEVEVPMEPVEPEEEPEPASPEPAPQVAPEPQEEFGERLNPSTGPPNEPPQVTQPQPIDIDEAFDDYLTETLDETEYAWIDCITTGRENKVWIVDQEALDRAVEAYEGVVPDFETILVPYSKKELDAAVAEIKSTDYYLKSYRKVSSVGAYEGSLTVRLLEPYPEFEDYLRENYGDIVEIRIIDKVNPAT